MCCAWCDTGAIVRASEYPLAIVAVGLGDGPFHNMNRFDDELPQRIFDNFQFVEMNAVLAETRQAPHPSGMSEDDEFALAALMELPGQYDFCNEHNLVGRMVARSTAIGMLLSRVRHRMFAV
jgi:E3 ubiquitin-protein ligase RGLG